MSNINIRRRISRQPYLFAAGLASVGLVCLQLLCDIDDYDMNRRRRQMESTNSLSALQIPSDIDIGINNSNSNDLRRQLRQLEKSTKKDTLKDSTTLRILQSNDYDNITDARLLADDTTITLEEVDEACNFAGILGPTEIPEDIEFAKTLIVGYPGADKRMVLRQAEAMTKLSGRDSWDLKYLGLTDQPFFKTNYPHHEGIWGWDEANQVILIVRNIRHTIDSYHDILADIDYAKTWAQATAMIPNLYKGTIYEVLYSSWRDERTMDEIGWYGWLIDYWMEGGIMRDYFDHKLTTPAHFARLRAPELWTYGELQWDYNNCETDGPITEISYDEVCNPAVTADCKPKVIISAERLMDNSTGREENRKIAMLLNETAGVMDYMVNETSLDCIYDSLIANNPTGQSPGEALGYIDYRNRTGVLDRKHHVSTRHLTKMVKQLTRLITKYSSNDEETGIDWTVSPEAQFLVELLTEHRAEIQEELDNTPVEQNWAHPPKTNWVVFPKCGPNAETGRRVWDYNYSDWLGAEGYSGLVYDMSFPINPITGDGSMAQLG